MTDIREQITILIALQGIELEILAADRKIVALKDEAISLEQATAEHEALVAAAKEAVDGLRKSYRELESESKANAAKIDKSNEKLRAVKTNKEYQSILKEIEEIRKQSSEIEDRMIELLDQLESQEGAVKQKEAKLASFLKECNEKKTAIADSVQKQEQTVEQLHAKQEQIKADADPKTIMLLDDVKTKVRGMAVVPVEKAVCMGCHMNIPAQLYNELLRYDELRFCPHCNRIIYWKEKVSE